MNPGDTDPIYLEDVYVIGSDIKFRVVIPCGGNNVVFSYTIRKNHFETFFNPPGELISVNLTDPDRDHGLTQISRFLNNSTTPNTIQIKSNQAWVHLDQKTSQILFNKLKMMYNDIVKNTIRKY